MNIRLMLTGVSTAVAVTLLGAAPAAADGRPSVEIDATADCGEATVTWINPTRHDYSGGYGVTDTVEVSVPAGETLTETVEAEDGTELRAWIDRPPDRENAHGGAVTEVEHTIEACEDEEEPEPTTNPTPDPSEKAPSADEGEESGRHQEAECEDVDDVDVPKEDGEDDENEGGDKETPAEGAESEEATVESDGTGGLPVTGGALAGLITAAVAAVGGGSTALWATRRRHAEDVDA